VGTQLQPSYTERELARRGPAHSPGERGGQAAEPPAGPALAHPPTALEKAPKTLRSLPGLLGPFPQHKTTMLCLTFLPWCLNGTLILFNQTLKYPDGCGESTAPKVVLPGKPGHPATMELDQSWQVHTSLGTGGQEGPFDRNLILAQGREAVKQIQARFSPLLVFSSVTLGKIT
jgi:hypothetical protein